MFSAYLYISHLLFALLGTSTVAQLEQDLAYFTDEEMHIDYIFIYIYIYIYISHLHAARHVYGCPTGAGPCILHR